MDKVIRDGKVAVLYSPGYGAGWYTWNTQYPQLVFDPALVAMVEDKTPDGWDYATYMETQYPNAYDGGADGLTIEWLPQGTAFEIHEYDGSESIRVREQQDWLIA